MLLRQEPPNFIDYIQVDEGHLNTMLQENDFYPKYYYEGHFFYKDSQELRNFIEKGGV